MKKTFVAIGLIVMALLFSSGKEEPLSVKNAEAA